MAGETANDIYLERVVCLERTPDEDSRVVYHIARKMKGRWIERRAMSGKGKGLNETGREAVGRACDPSISCI